MNDKTKDNMELWNSICDTDPAMTKRVNQRGGFTAIDAYYQIERATKVWGPVGIGWGWEVKNVHIIPEHSVIVEIRFWHSGDRDAYFDECGQASLGKPDRPDVDAVKKATTDSLTKSFSRVGMCSDVFMGKFDNNKYVEEMTKKYAKVHKQEATEAATQAQKELTELILGHLENAKGTVMWDKFVGVAMGKPIEEVGTDGAARIRKFVDDANLESE